VISEREPSARVVGARVPVSSDVKQNVAWVDRALAYGAAERATVVVTPEGMLSGFEERADEDAVRDALREIPSRVAQHQTALALGICHRESPDRRLVNELRLYAPSGDLIATHRKLLLCDGNGAPGDEDAWDESREYEVGTELSIARLGDLRVGLLICNDLWANPVCTVADADPRLATSLSRLGADLILHAANTGLETTEAFDSQLVRSFHESNLRMRAWAAQRPIFSVDVADPSCARGSHSPSGLVSADGEWIAKAPAKGPELFAVDVP
jgi:predicted amidohydrolase